MSYNGAFAHYTCLPCRRRGFDSLHSLKNTSLDWCYVLGLAWRFESVTSDIKRDLRLNVTSVVPGVAKRLQTSCLNVCVGIVVTVTTHFMRVSYNGASAYYTCLPSRGRGFDSLHSLYSGYIQQDLFIFRQTVNPLNVGSIPTLPTNN